MKNSLNETKNKNNQFIISSRIKTFVIILSILATILILYKLYEKNSEPKFSNPPCWYYANESIREIRMYGINSTNVTILINKDRLNFFVIEKNTELQIEKCII